MSGFEDNTQQLPVELAEGAEMQPDAIAVELSAINDGIGNLIVALAETAGSLVQAIEERGAEVETTLQAETGRILAAVAAVTGFAGGPKPAGFGVKRVVAAAGLAASIAVAAVGGVFIGAMSGLGQPLAHEEMNRATYLWLTHQMKLRNCMDAAFKNGGPVQCKITIDLYK